MANKHIKKIYQSEITIAYFYIIRHIYTKIMYVGCRYAANCCPDEFMKSDGYMTNSKIITEIIAEEGLDVFEILRIDTYCDGMHVLDYEKLFLNVYDCRASK